MLKRKLTLMLIPSSDGVSRQVSIPVALIYSVASVVMVMLLANVFLTADFFSDQVSDQELDKLRVENRQLAEKYDQLRWDIAEVSDRYDQLVEKEIAIRTIFDLPEISVDERQLGIGGPGGKSVGSMSMAEKSSVQTEVEVDRLLRLSAFELEKYGEVSDELTTLKDRLAHTPSIWPTKGWLQDGFGYRQDPFTGYKTYHRGLDIAYPSGTPVAVTADGKVTSVGKMGNMGNMITVDHGYGFVTRYGHLSKFEVKRGQRVKRGDLIGLMGRTGRVTGPHLHYEVWRNGKALNPRDYTLNKLQK